jgi:cytochrome c oxidase subunit IV
MAHQAMTDQATTQRESRNQPHVLSLWVYFSVAGVLLALTVLTVAVTKVDLGEWNVAVALLIAALKATLVILFFMHLFYDNKVFAIVFSTGVIFLSVFIILTMSDTEYRDVIYSERAAPIHAEAEIYSTSNWNEPEDTGKDYALSAWQDLSASEEYVFGDALASYKKLCAVCHGERGKGDGFNAFNLDPKPKSFSDSTVSGKFTDEFLYRVISEGGEGVELSASMPPYKYNLTEAEIRRLAEFVRVLSTTE